MLQLLAEYRGKKPNVNVKCVRTSIQSTGANTAAWYAASPGEYLASSTLSSAWNHGASP